MIGYVTVGTNDMPRAAAFYDALFGAIGAARMMEMERYIAWGVAQDKPGFSICKPFDGQPATVGNGVMIAFNVDAPATVDALYNKAMQLGAADEGAPGERGVGYYAAYFRDLDGNKLSFFCGD
jgi:catechol 2,3-dioxygenase-like lactoylglutathione lyase family enzyme